MIEQKKWRLRVQCEEGQIERLEGFKPLEAKLLLARGIQDPQIAGSFIDTDIFTLENPFDILGMDVAVDRILKALESNQRIVVYGDYDADGVTATALLSTGLKDLGADVSTYIPDRFKEGYGLNDKAIEKLASEGSSLLITVDCGIRAVDEVGRAINLGMDVIITDHHKVGNVLPPAVVILDPHQDGDLSKNKNLAGVGMAFKLLHGVMTKKGRGAPIEYLDFVSIGSVADMVHLTGENRFLVREGLKRINLGERPGINGLIDICGYRIGEIDAMKIAFGLGPRINAAGRIASANTALDLLMERDEDLARQRAIELDGLNKTRQDLTAETRKLVRDEIDKDNLPPIILAAASEYHEGILGLTASRIVDEFYRPTIIGRRGDEFTRASARSIPEFSIIAALQRCSHYLVRFGGHDAAAGFTVRNDVLEEFHHEIAQIAQDELADVDLIPSLSFDAFVSFSDLDWDLLLFQDKLEPFGSGNPAPSYCTKNARIQNKRRVGTDGAHLKISLVQDDRLFDAIAFRLGDRYDSLADNVDVLFRFERNVFRGSESLQLNVLDVRNEGSLAS
ncbi:MAG: single-stranded-DNA-specific exonuclease RecJ [Anaerolineales bacterium]